MDFGMMAEQRAAARYRCCGRVEIPVAYSSVPLFGIVLDMSVAGCGICIPSGFLFDPERETPVEMAFMNGYFSFRAMGAVKCTYVHKDFQGSMLGVEFTSLNARARADIEAFVQDQVGKEPSTLR